MIGESIESVIQQNYPHFEHIIIDGGSTDGTLEVIGQYPHIRLTSEPDRGLYDAINKGISQARGDVVGLLNSDDFYEAHAFSHVVAGFSQGGDEWDAVCGGVEIFQDPDHEGGERSVLYTFNDPPVKALSPQNITVGIPLTNGRFFRREVYERVGPYDLRYRVAADRQWLLRAWEKGIQSRPLPQVIYKYRAHEGSLTFNQKALCDPHGDHEYIRLCEDFFQSGELSPAAHQVCRAWHTWETGYVMLHALRGGAFQKAWDMGKRGWRRDLLWPLRFAGQVGARLLKGL
jgi:glycosyltransferase involved in cell wall biosynthesis